MNQIIEDVVECVKSVGGNVKLYGERIGEPNNFMVVVDDIKEVDIDKLQSTLDEVDVEIEYIGRSYGVMFFTLNK